MSRSFGGLAVGVALVLLSVSVLLPAASADHAYSHRSVVYGRVVDADGNPGVGLTVDLAPEFIVIEGSCNPNQPNTATDAFGPTYTKPVTNDYGEFTFCLHTHGLSRFEPGRGTLRVDDDAGNELATKEMRFDGYSRVVFVTVELPTSLNGTSTLFDSSYTVAGRLWEDSGEQHIEGVTVFGDTLKFKPVEVTLNYNNGETATLNTTSNGYGDWAVRLPTTARVTSGTVTVTAENKTVTQDVNSKMGISTFDMRYDAPKDPFLAKVLIGLGIVAGIVIVLVAGTIGYRKMTERRAEVSARAHSTRKRAQR